MVAYVHKEYSTYQFLEESKGGGWNPTPPRSLRYRKKRGPERVKFLRMKNLPVKHRFMMRRHLRDTAFNGVGTETISIL